MNGNDTHGVGGSYRITDAGDRELLERTKTREEAAAEEAGKAAKAAPPAPNAPVEAVQADTAAATSTDADQATATTRKSLSTRSADGQ